MISQIRIKYPLRKPEEGLTLRVEKYDFGIRFWTEYKGYRPSYSFFIRQDPTDPKSFIIKKQEANTDLDLWTDSYEKYGVGNLCEFFMKLVLNPREILKVIYGDSKPISEAIVENFSQKYPHRFDSC